MNRINEYKVEPGVYTHKNGSDYVVLDVITHQWNADAQLHEAVENPYVVYRDLNYSNTIHTRNMIKLKDFPQTFTKKDYGNSKLQETIRIESAQRPETANDQSL